MTKSSCSLILPNLAPLFTQHINHNLISKSLKQIINKADFEPIETGLQSCILSQFADVTESADLAIAALRYHSDKALLCVDPCYLHADRDRLLLFAQELAITDDEAEQLISCIQPLFDDFQAKLIKINSNQWLAEIDKLPSLRFTALEKMEGQHIEAGLPVGDKNDRADWLRLWNEIQMSLFASPINELRQQQGKLPINSVWFWGAEKLRLNQNHWQLTIGNQPELQLLSDIADINCLPAIEENELVSQLNSHNVLYCYPAFDWDNITDQLADVEQLLCALFQKLKWGGFADLTLMIPHYGCYTLRPLSCWKLWK